MRASGAVALQKHAERFAALGDPTRLRLVSRLAAGKSRSISQLTEGTKVTRQAVTKHLRVLEQVGVVHSFRQGRESLYKLDAKPFGEMQDYLEIISKQWDEALNNLKSFVEE